jgi:iron complex transport system substrate-binding protein
MKKFAAALLALMLILSLMAGCGSQSSNDSGAPAPDSSAAAGVEFTDMLGREIKLDAPADKVVVLSAADCEILCAIGAESTIVGRGTYCDYPASVSSITEVASGSDTNVEQIIALAPQVVITSSMDQSKETLDAIEKAGIKVVVSQADTIDEVYTAIGNIGKVVGKDAEAEALVASMKASFDEIAAKKDNTGKTVYFEVSPLVYGLWTAGKGTFMNELAELVGLRNIFDDVEGWAEVSAEQVIERNPDYIVTITMYFGEGPTPVEEILSRDGWQGITAVKNAAILNADSNEISRPGPRLTDAAKILSAFVLGEN